MEPVSTLSSHPDHCGRNGATTVFIILSSITMGMATIVVPLRIYVRIYIVQSVWWDDVCLIVAYCILVPYFSLLWSMVDRGLGRQTHCVPEDHLKYVIELEVITEFFQIICTIFSRLSVALFIGRLFAVTRKARLFLYSYTAFMCISMVVTAILTCTICYPVKVIWDVQPGSLTTCSSRAGIMFRNYYNGVVGTLSDFILALTPLYFLHKLQLNWKSKLSLSLLLTVGLIPAITCLVRTVVISSASDYEPLGSFAIVVLFGSTEASMLIVCATIPSLRPLFIKDAQKNMLVGAPGWEVFCKVPPAISRTATPRPQNQVRVTRTWSVASFTHLVSREVTRTLTNVTSRASRSEASST